MALYQQRSTASLETFWLAAKTTDDLLAIDGYICQSDTFLDFNVIFPWRIISCPPWTVVLSALLLVEDLQEFVQCVATRGASENPASYSAFMAPKFSGFESD